MSLAVVAALGSAAPASAETVIGVVNLQKIMHESKAAQSVRAQLQAKQKSFQADLDTKEKALYNEDQSLAKEQAAATDKAAFEAKVKDFKGKAAAAQREVQEKKAQLDKAFAGALDKIQQSVFAAVKDVAAQHKMNVVISGSQVLYADAPLDVTDEVLKKLDAQLPDLKVQF